MEQSGQRRRCSSGFFLTRRFSSGVRSLPSDDSGHQRPFPVSKPGITVLVLPMNDLRLFFRPRRLSTFLALFALGGATTLAHAGSLRVRQVSARSVTRGPAMEAMAASELRPAERAFLGKAVEVGRQQMRLAEVGVGHATSSDVRSHAQQLATDYRSLNESLDALVRRKGGIPGAPVGGTSETYQKLVTQSGANFDREFVRTVSRVTDGVLALFEQVASESKDADVREFAAAQLPLIRAHRTTATELQKTFD